MLASIAAERMREQPGCRSVATVEIVDTPDGWELGTIIHSGATPGNRLGMITVHKCQTSAQASFALRLNI
jgi:hypothetical protein